MFGIKINNNLGFIVNCRCCVGEIAAISWWVQNGYFPKNFTELYHTRNTKILFRPEEKEFNVKTTFTVYKDPFIRMVDNFALITTGKWCKFLQKRMFKYYNFNSDSSFKDFIEVIKQELSREDTEGHFIPISDTIKNYYIDYVIDYTNLKPFFEKQLYPFNDFNYNECDKLNYDDYLEYKPLIYDLYKDDLKILENNLIWTPE